MLGYTWNVSLEAATMEQLEYELNHLNEVIPELEGSECVRYTADRTAVRQRLAELYVTEVA